MTVFWKRLVTSSSSVFVTSQQSLLSPHYCIPSPQLGFTGILTRIHNIITAHSKVDLNTLTQWAAAAQLPVYPRLDEHCSCKYSICICASCILYLRRRLFQRRRVTVIVLLTTVRQLEDPPSPSFVRRSGPVMGAVHALNFNVARTNCIELHPEQKGRHSKMSWIGYGAASIVGAILVAIIFALSLTLTLTLNLCR